MIKYRGFQMETPMHEVWSLSSVYFIRVLCQMCIWDHLLLPVCIIFDSAELLPLRLSVVVWQPDGRYAISHWLTPGQLCGLLDERPRACFSLRLHPLLIPLFSKSILTFPLFPHSTHTYAQMNTGIDRNVLFFNTFKFCCLNHKTLQGVQSLICGLITNHST